MTPRAIWKGYLQLGAVTCPVALYTAASTSDRIVFNTVNRATGHRVRREFVDSETGDAVEKDDQVKGYEAEKDQYVVLEADEIAAAAVQERQDPRHRRFCRASDIDEAFLDKPYYLAPADRTGDEFFVVLRDGLRDRDAVAVAHAVLFRRLRALLIRPHGAGLIATTLHFDYEVRSATEVFASIPDLRIKTEMLDLARHIIETKQGAFDPADYQDRYEAALADLVKAKLEGRTIAAPKKQKPRPALDLMQALRDSAGPAREKPVPLPEPPNPPAPAAESPQTARARRRKAS